MTSWRVLVVGLGALTVLSKAAGVLVLSDRELPRPVAARLALLAPALFAAFVATQTFLEEVVSWAERSEAALVGTAVVMAGVGAVIHDGARITVGDGKVGANTRRLRGALVAVQRGGSEDLWGWTEVVP